MKSRRSGHILTAAGLALTMSPFGVCSFSISGGKPGVNALSTVKSAGGATLIFAQCMCDKGFDVPDTDLTVDSLNNISDAFNDAIGECQQKVGPVLGEENDLTRDPAAQEQLAKGAGCLCDLGYDVTDPEVGKGLDVEDIPPGALQKCFSNQGA